MHVCNHQSTGANREACTRYHETLDKTTATMRLASPGMPHVRHQPQQPVAAVATICVVSASSIARTPQPTAGEPLYSHHSPWLFVTSDCMSMDTRLARRHANQESAEMCEHFVV